MRVAAALVGALLASGSARAAQEEPSGPARRGFEPALMIGFGVNSEDLSADQSADFVDIQPGRQGLLRFSFSQAELALFSPTLTDTLGLRVFLHGGGQFPFTRLQLGENSLSSFNTGDFSNPTGFQDNCATFPPNEPSSNPRERFPRFTNGFCEIRSRNETIANGSLFAGLGVDITLPVASRQFHLRPSLNWFGQSLKGEGSTTRSTSGDGQPIVCSNRRQTYGGKPCNDQTLNEFGRDTLDIYQASFNQTEMIRAKTGEVWMHGIGPRLELDVEVAKVGNAIFEIFAQGAIYWILTDRRIEFSGSGLTGDGLCTQDGPTTIVFEGERIAGPDYCSRTVPGGAPIRAFYRTRAGPTVVQFGGGFRVIWKGLGW